MVGLLAPAKTPKDLVDKLSEEVRKASEMPAVARKLLKRVPMPLAMSPSAFEALMRKGLRSLDKPDAQGHLNSNAENHRE